MFVASGDVRYWHGVGSLNVAKIFPIEQSTKHHGSSRFHPRSTLCSQLVPTSIQFFRPADDVAYPRFKRGQLCALLHRADVSESGADKTIFGCGLNENNNSHGRNSRWEVQKKRDSGEFGLGRDLLQS